MYQYCSHGKALLFLRCDGVATRAFTLIELLVVLAVLAVLSALMVPVLAGTKGEVWRAGCRNQMGQIGRGFRLFQQDHNDMFPPAGYSTSGGMLSWDSYIHRYLGGKLSESDLAVGSFFVGEGALNVLRCPADVQPKVNWVGNPPWFALRSYAMVGAGPVWSSQYGVNTRSHTYPLPTISLGVGVY
jgi:prepilin-type N-terminal cleavage/methylation domain-containing protein